MQQRRTHYFPENGCRVVTGLAPVGGFVAFVEGEEMVRGRGQTRLAAIADLNKAIEAVGSIYERDETFAQAAE